MHRFQLERKLEMLQAITSTENFALSVHYQFITLGNMPFPQKKALSALGERDLNQWTQFLKEVKGKNLIFFKESNELGEVGDYFLPNEKKMCKTIKFVLQDDNDESNLSVYTLFVTNFDKKTWSFGAVLWEKDGLYRKPCL